jgi:site-specific DNA-cytosine methylase
MKHLIKLVIIVNIFYLDASKMGVPQRRERVFFICLRKDLATKFLHWQICLQKYQK